MTDGEPGATIEINLPGEDPEPPEYEKIVEFGEKFREKFGDYRWEFGLLAGADGETVEIPPVPSCIDAAFRIHVAGVLAEDQFPRRVYDDPDVDGDFLLTDQDLGNEEIAVTVTATRRDGSSHQAPDGQARGVHEHWHIGLTYDLADDAVVTSEKVSNPAITIEKL